MAQSPDVLRLDDVGVRQAGDGLQLALELADGVGLRRQVVVEHLEGHDALHEQVLRLVHRPHAAAAEDALDAVPRAAH